MRTLSNPRGGLYLEGVSTRYISEDHHSIGDVTPALEDRRANDDALGVVATCVRADKVALVLFEMGEFKHVLLLPAAHLLHSVAIGRSPLTGGTSQAKYFTELHTLRLKEEVSNNLRVARLTSMQVMNWKVSQADFPFCVQILVIALSAAKCLHGGEWQTQQLSLSGLFFLVSEARSPPQDWDQLCSVAARSSWCA